MISDNLLPYSIDDPNDYHSRYVTGIWVNGRHIEPSRAVGFDIQMGTVTLIDPAPLSGMPSTDRTVTGSVTVEYTIKGKRTLLNLENDYLKRNPHVEYTINDRGVKSIKHDDDKIHFLLSTKGAR